MSFPHYIVLDIALVRIRIDTQSYLVGLDGIDLTQLMTVCGGCDEVEEGKCGQIASHIAKKKLVQRILYSETSSHDMIKPPRRVRMVFSIIEMM